MASATSSKPFGAGVVRAHQALKLGELADHLGDKVGFGKAGRLLRLLNVCADDFSNLTSQRLDAGNALALGAQLGVEGDFLEVVETGFELGLPVQFPEEFRIRQPRGDDLVIALDNLLPAVPGDQVGDQQVVDWKLAGSWS
jgi:hypothetical protein